MLYKELDLPAIPNDIIPSKEEISNSTTDTIPKHTSFYQTFQINPELHKWLKDYINLTDEYKAQFQFLTNHIPVHIDYGRTAVLNYLFETGSKDPVYTNFYSKDKNDLLDRTHKIEIPCYKWHVLKTDHLHDVSYIPGTRVALSIWASNINPWFVS